MTNKPHALTNTDTCSICKLDHTVGRSFFVGYKFREFRDFLKIRENYFRKNQILTVQDGRRHKFAKIKSAKLILRQISEIYSPRKKGALRYVKFVDIIITEVRMELLVK